MSFVRTMRSAVLLTAFALVACGGGASGGSDQASDTAADTKTEAKPAADTPAEKPMAEAETKKEAPAMAPLRDPKSPEMNQTAPETFDVKFETTKGDFVVQVTRAWAPLGADRFYNLVKNGFYTDMAVFRVIPGFMAQFGMSGDPSLQAVWTNASINDDPVTQSNTRGMVTYAKRNAPHSRTTQLFINFGNNAGLDGQGFAPFGKVDEEGMKVVDQLFSGYGDPPTGPNQGQIISQGNKYLKESFPNLDYIKQASIVAK